MGLRNKLRRNSKISPESIDFETEAEELQQIVTFKTMCDESSAHKYNEPDGSYKTSAEQAARRAENYAGNCPIAKKAGPGASTENIVQSCPALLNYVARIESVEIDQIPSDKRCLFILLEATKGITPNSIRR